MTFRKNKYWSGHFVPRPISLFCFLQEIIRKLCADLKTVLKNTRHMRCGFFIQDSAATMEAAAAFKGWSAGACSILPASTRAASAGSMGILASKG